MSHGYQSSLSWLSDLLGHALFEDPAFDDYSNQEKVRFDELQGLVLIDELDLHIHPTWQRGFIGALSETFPGLQFVASTHSPLLLSALRPDEVVALELGPDDTVQRQQLDVDPRVLTGSELYEEVFDTPSLPAQPLGEVLSDYEFWACNPFRDDRMERAVKEWRTRLAREGVAIPFEPVPRSPRGQRR
ncbi:MAG: AAA family ATPase [Phycisphaeraceae bacterium]|nr:AAA family ATPase [Phycisphaeraceae bacterium]